MAVNSFLNRCYFAATSSGTGDFVVSAAVTGYMTPAQSGAGDGATYGYFAQSADLSQWEVGVGTYTVSTTTLARTTVSLSSNSNAKVSFSAAPNVGLTPVASDLPNDLVKLNEIITSGSQATVDFTNINQNFRHLKIIYAAQDTAAGSTFASLFMKINNDGTSGNYQTTVRAYSLNGTLDGSGVAPTSSGGWVGLLNTSTNYMGTGEINVPDYVRTVFQKGYFGVWADLTAFNGVFAGSFGGFWKDNSAINRLTFSTANNFLDNSVFTLYGLR